MTEMSVKPKYRLTGEGTLHTYIQKLMHAHTHAHTQYVGKSQQ